MKKYEQGSVRFLVVLIIVIGGLFVFKAEDGESYGKKVIAKIEGAFSGLKQSTLDTRDAMQAHENELQQQLDELQ